MRLPRRHWRYRLTFQGSRVGFARWAPAMRRNPTEGRLSFWTKKRAKWHARELERSFYRRGIIAEVEVYDDRKDRP